MKVLYDRNGENLGNLEVDVGESEGCCGMKERGEDILGFMLKYLH